MKTIMMNRTQHLPQVQRTEDVDSCLQMSFMSPGQRLMDRCKTRLGAQGKKFSLNSDLLLCCSQL